MATYELLINDAPLVVGRDASLVSIAVRYQCPREFAFSVPASAQRIALGSTCEFTVDGVMRFCGLVMDWQPSPTLAGSDIYRAYDYAEMAGDVQLVKPRDDSQARYLNFLLNRAPFVALSEILNAMSNAFAAELVAVGAAASWVVFSGVTEGWLAQCNVSDGSFPEVLTAILSGLPGYTWLWEPENRQFVIVNLYRSPTQTVTVGSDLVTQLAMNMSIRDRYTVVTCVGKPLNAPTPVSVDCVPDWDEELEEGWAPDLVTGQDSAEQAYDEEMQKVFRRWSFKDALESSGYSINADFPVDLRVKIRVRKDPAKYRWISVKVANVDTDLGYIEAEEPLIRGVDVGQAGIAPAFQVGGSQKALDVKLRFVGTHVVRPEYTCGPGGSAYAQYGLLRHRYEYDQSNDDLSAESVAQMLPSRASLMLDALGDVAISGSVPLAGSVPDWLWNLNVRVNVSVPNRNLGTESMAAVVTGFTHSFDGCGSTTLELSTDRSSFVGRGMM
ncbi:MAG TPA: hypothetical protein PKY77_05800 [Phycisphaerae bacterium]|nr:hypothetical protein [Phycisphaerae bacterium]HRY69042.1 hypothetical protein [Phycisphaerae bacterium]HSA25983.1 hypothetical protein [Phycisphaerae bacterium]